MKTATHLLLALTPVLAACDASTPLRIGSGGAGPVARSTVDGTWIDLYVTESGKEMVPRDLSAATILAEYQRTTGGWEAVSGTGRSDGTFTIPDVPETPFYLSIRGEALGEMYYTKARHIDVGTAFGGRKDQTSILSSANVLANFTEAAPWADGDRLSFFSFDANGASGDLDKGVVGATDIPPVNFQWGGGLPNAKDHVYATQYARHTASDGSSVESLVSFGNVPSLPLKDGGAAVVTVPLGPISTVETASINVQTSKLIAIAEASPLDKVVEAVGTAVLAAPHAQDLGELEVGAGELLRAYPPSSSADLAFDGPYANPFPASFDKFLVVDVNAVFELAPDGSSSDGSLPLPFFFSIPLSEVSSDPIAPPLSAPTALQIDGHDATVPTSASSRFPVLSWDAPKLGAPAVYRIETFHIPADLTHALPDYLGSVDTSEPTLPLLPGSVMPGETYVFEVIANMGSDLSETSPNARSARSATTAAVTNRITFGK